jgi:hypothetical protein
MDIHDIENANIGSVMEKGGVWEVCSLELDSTSRNLRVTAKLPDWEGTAADSMRHRLDSSTNRMSIAGLRSGAVGMLTAGHATALTAPQGAVRAVLQAARMTGMKVEPDGTVHPGGDGASGTVNRLLSAVGGPVGSLVNGSAQAMTTVLKGAMASVSGLDLAAEKAVSTACDIDRAPSASPVEFSPGAIAELTGDPAAAAASGTVTFPSSLDGTLSGDKKEELTRAVHEARRSLALRGLDPAEIGVSVMDIEGSPSVVVGDLASADKVSTLVSGVKSSDAGAAVGTAASAGRIAGPGHAVVAWHGYSAPGNLVTGTVDVNASRGAPALQKAQQNLRERTGKDTELQIIAHSYGTVLTGYTARTQDGGLEADTVQLLGSPGTEAFSVDKMNLNALDGDAEVHVWNELADPISLATDQVGGVHGKDPASPAFGADSVDGVERDKDQGILGTLGEYLTAPLGFVDDAYLWLNGEWNAHSAYLSDEQVLEKLR